MKRVFVFIFISLIFAVSYSCDIEFDISNLMNTAENYYSTFSQEVNDVNLIGVNNGQLYHVFSDISNFNYINKKYCNTLIGETFVFENANNINSILNELNFKQFDSYVVGNKVVVEGYSPKLKKFVVKGGVKLNLQICFGEVIKVGYPCIMEGF